MLGVVGMIRLWKSPSFFWCKTGGGCQYIYNDVVGVCIMIKLWKSPVSSVVTQAVGVCIMMRSQGEQGSRLRPTDTIVISPPVEPPGRLLTFFTINYLTFNNQTMTWHQAASKAAPRRLEKLLTRLNFFIVTAENQQLYRRGIAITIFGNYI